MDNAAAIARAYKIGPKESEAVKHLTQKVAKPVVESLKAAVRTRGMKGFLNHEAIAKEVFNVAWTSGFSQFEAWHDVLTNKEDSKLATCIEVSEIRVGLWNWAHDVLTVSWQFGLDVSFVQAVLTFG